MQRNPLNKQEDCFKLLILFFKEKLVPDNWQQRASLRDIRTKSLVETLHAG
jgi:hypothetical protein